MVRLDDVLVVILFLLLWTWHVSEQDVWVTDVIYTLILMGVCLRLSGCIRWTLRWIMTRVKLGLMMLSRLLTSLICVLRRQLRHVMPPMRFNGLRLSNC